jgi:hypothetical protein
MPRRDFHRSQTEAFPSRSCEDSYRRAAGFLRDFHRSRSLDVIIEVDDDHHDSVFEKAEKAATNGFTSKLKKKSQACLCLADLAMDGEEESSNRDENESSTGDVTQRQGFGSGELDNWGHFLEDNDMSFDSYRRSRPAGLGLPMHRKPRNTRKFGPRQRY